MVVGRTHARGDDSPAPASLAARWREPVTGRRVLVTGAAGAFGSATVDALRGRGAAVIGLDLEHGDSGSPAAPHQPDIGCDITDDDQVATAVATAVDRLGGLDALVHYAGVGEPGDAGAAPGPGVARSLDVNLLGPWRVTAEVLPELLRSRGRVVFVASELAYATLPFASPYAVSKRALTAYADALRLECGGRVAVSTVYPGYVRTPIHERSASLGLSMEGSVRAERVSDIAGRVLDVLGRKRPPRDVAGTRLGQVELRLARHLPGLVDRAVRGQVRRQIAGGRYDGVPLARGLVQRHRNPDDLSGPLTAPHTPTEETRS